PCKSTRGLDPSESPCPLAEGGGSGSCCHHAARRYTRSNDRQPWRLRHCLCVTCQACICLLVEQLDSMHNDILPLAFAAAGVVAALRCGNFPLSRRIALALQAVPALGLWVTTLFC